MIVLVGICANECLFVCTLCYELLALLRVAAVTDDFLQYKGGVFVGASLLCLSASSALCAHRLTPRIRVLHRPHQHHRHRPHHQRCRMGGRCTDPAAILGCAQLVGCVPLLLWLWMVVIFFIFVYTSICVCMGRSGSLLIVVSCVFVCMQARSGASLAGHAFCAAPTCVSALSVVGCCLCVIGGPHCLSVPVTYGCIQTLAIETACSWAVPK